MKKKLILKTLPPSMEAHNGFVWPEKGQVVCPDWQPTPECGHGLHGLLWGEGNAGLLHQPNDPKTRWLVAEITDYVDLDGKVKFPRCKVVYCGERDQAINYICDRAPHGTRVVYLCRSGGDRATLTGGDYATLIGGANASLTGGDYATLIGGANASLTGGDYATLIGGANASLTGGFGATLTGGFGATLTGGDGATLTGGAYASLTGGDRATLIGGACTSLTGKWWDGSRYRLTTVYIGEGYEAGVPYLFKNGTFTRQ